MIFNDRKQAGEMLAEKLDQYKGQDAIIYALPRGGVVCGYEIARKLHLPLDIILTKKIGHPFDPEFAICAISESGILECGEGSSGIDIDWLKDKEKETHDLLLERREKYKKEPISPEDKIAILVDDGIATGLTIMVAIREIKQYKPKKIVVAVPVSLPEIAASVKATVDDFVAIELPEDFALAVGAYYIDFPEIGDDEVIELIKKAKESYEHND